MAIHEFLSGDGWVENGDARYWGLYGAAGLLLIDVTTHSVLLQHRATWVSSGGTWALPGGARHKGESAVDAALRESVEECGIDVEKITVRGWDVTFEDSGVWSYTTVFAVCQSAVDTHENEESQGLEWVPIEQVASYNLLPAFRSSWGDILQNMKQWLHD